MSFSILVTHGLDDGTVSVAILIEAFETTLSNEANPKITVDGQMPTVYVALTKDPDSASTMSLLTVEALSLPLVHESRLALSPDYDELLLK